jgi:methyl-accepting chemotaxis protein
VPLPRLRTSLRAQLVATGAGAVAVTAALLTAVGGWQVTGLASDAGDDVDRLVSDSMAQTTQQAVTLVETQVATVTDRMASDMRVAQQTFAQAGDLSFGAPERWTVTDQTTKAQTEADLPQLLVGGTWLGRTIDPAAPAGSPPPCAASPTATSRSRYAARARTRSASWARRSARRSRPCAPP